MITTTIPFPTSSGATHLTDLEVTRRSQKKR